MKEFIVSYETEQIENNEFFYGGKIESKLIRCKDCKYWDRDRGRCVEIEYSKCNADDYCSRAERKEE